MATAVPDTSPDLALPECGKQSWPPPLSVRCAGVTHPGCVRHNNEDQFLIATISRALQVVASSFPQQPVQYGPYGHLFAVADGVGGSAGGERASEQAVLTIEHFIVQSMHYCHKIAEGVDDPLAHGLRDALKLADARLYQEAQRRPEFYGMGTTLTLAVCHGADLYIAHVGDSRCYLLRNGVLKRLTHDHTLMAELIDRGVLTPEQASKHKLRHVITNVVGGTTEGITAEISHHTLAVGDVLLLCSDGLTEMAEEADIRDVLLRVPDPGTAAAQLIQLANDRGGRDNVTVVVARFEG